MRLFAAGGGSDETDGSRDRSNQRKVGSIPRNFQYALTGFSGSVVWRQFMSGKHGHSHKPFEGHMHDFDAHIRAVEEDLEYYRAKRFEPRIFYLLRRGVVTFADLLKARVAPRGTHGECGARLERLPGIARGICPGADPSRLGYPGGVGAALEAAPRGAAVDGRRDCRQGVDRCDIQASAVNDGERSAQRNGRSE